MQGSETKAFKVVRTEAGEGEGRIFRVAEGVDVSMQCLNKDGRYALLMRACADHTLMSTILVSMKSVVDASACRDHIILVHRLAYR